MLLDQIIDDLTTTFNHNWYVDAWSKFKAHPLNFQGGEKFNAHSLVKYGEDNAEIRKVVFRFNDFLEYGWKIEISDFREKSGARYPGDFYNHKIEDPKHLLGDWEARFKAEFDLCFGLLNTLVEKERFLDYVIGMLRSQLDVLHSSKNEKLKEVITAFIKSHIANVQNMAGRISGLQAVVEYADDGLRFDLTEAQLAKMIYLLRAKFLLDQAYSDAEITRLFSKFTMITDRRGQWKKPQSLSAAYRRLAANSKQLNQWADSITIGL